MTDLSLSNSLDLSTASSNDSLDEYSYSAIVQGIPMMSGKEEKAAYRAMNSAVLSQLAVMTESSSLLEELKDIILSIEHEREKYDKPDQQGNKRKTSTDLNLIGLIDNLQTFLYFKDTRRSAQTRRQLKKKLVEWLPSGYQVNDHMARWTKTKAVEKDARRDWAEIRQRIHKASAGYVKNRNRLSDANLRLVFSIANRFRYLGLPYEDLVQEGSLGLIKAIERFDPAKGFLFSTYAFRVISQTIHLAIDKNANLVRKPFRQLREKAVVDQTRNRLEQSLGRAPNSQDLQRHLPDTLEDKAPHIARNTQPTADSQTLYLVSPDPEEHPVLENSAQAFQTHFLKNRALLESAIKNLDERSQRVLRMRYGIGISQNYTLREISENLSLSGERVRQIALKAVAQLQENLQPPMNE